MTGVRRLLSARKQESEAQGGVPCVNPPMLKSVRFRMQRNGSRRVALIIKTVVLKAVFC